MLPACTGYLHKQTFIIRSLFEFFKDFFHITSVSFLVPLFRVCAFVTFFNKYCVTVCVLLCISDGTRFTRIYVGVLWAGGLKQPRVVKNQQFL